MDFLYQFFHQLHSVEGLEQLIRAGGLFFLFAIVFAETGLLLGFFLPGDSLLVTAGILSSASLGTAQPIFHFYTLNGVLIIAAVLGDQCGFVLGSKIGASIFKRPDGRLFKKKYILEAGEFYKKHGGKAILLARFVPILRTFVPFVAGVSQMQYRRFVIFNVVGGVSWVLSMTTVGHFLGRSRFASQIDRVVLLVVFVSVLPLILHFAKGLLKRREV